MDNNKTAIGNSLNRAFDCNLERMNIEDKVFFTYLLEWLVASRQEPAAQFSSLSQTSQPKAQ